MSNDSSKSIPRFPSAHYGTVEFEGENVPCAFGGEPGKLTAFIMIQGVCQIVGLSIEEEVDRIWSHHLLRDGLFLVPFQFIDPKGKIITQEVPAITLTRLHTWLALIPPEIVPDGVLRTKLIATQRELADVIYGYFGRRLLPKEIRDEDDPYIDPNQKLVFDALEEANQLAERVSTIETNYLDLNAKVDRLMITVSVGEAKEKISADQQEQLRAMMDILGNRYEQKRGKGTRGALISPLKDQFNFRYYNTVHAEVWPSLVQELVQIFRSLNPAGTPLPRVFEIALQSTNQKTLF